MNYREPRGEPRVLLGKMLRGKGVEYPPVKHLAKSAFKGFAGYGSAMSRPRRKPWRRWALYASALALCHLAAFYFLFGWGAGLYERVLEYLRDYI